MPEPAIEAVRLPPMQTPGQKTLFTEEVQADEWEALWGHREAPPEDGDIVDVRFAAFPVNSRIIARLRRRRALRTS